MALAPADFYAYSQATGTPYPEDPEERAALAPQVAAFRRSQLQPAQEQSNLPGILGAAALGLGALAGGAVLARRFAGKKPTSTVGLTAEGAQNVQNIGTMARQAANEAAVIQARAERPQGIQQVDLSAVNKLLNDKSLLAAVEAQEAVESLTPQQLSEFRGAESRARNEYRGAITAIGDEIIAQERAAAKIPVVNQTLGALESGEDQVTGRILRGVQRNEDLDSSVVNAVAKQTGNAEVAASLTPDGVPKDQLELNQPYTAQELVEVAKQEMLSRRQSLVQAGMRPGTVRFERALAQPFRTSQNAVVTGTAPVGLALPAGAIRQTVESVGAGEPLIETAVLNIGPQAVLTSTAAGTAIRGASPSYYEALPKQELRQLYGAADPLVPGAPDELVPDLPASLRIRGGVAPDVEPELLSKQEIQYSVLDRPQVAGPAGGSAGIGIYGIEPGFVPGAVTKSTGEYSEASSRKPSYVPGWLQRKAGRTGFENLNTAQLATAAENAKAPKIQAALENEMAKRETAKQSMEVSEVMRRARIEGRDPQMVLRQRGFNV
jgi:hypothetical protein